MKKCDKILKHRDYYWKIIFVPFADNKSKGREGMRLIMKINKDTKIGELMDEAPEKVDILLQAGMHCIGCPASQDETIEEACMVHGIDVEEIIEEINK